MKTHRRKSNAEKQGTPLDVLQQNVAQFTKEMAKRLTIWGSTALAVSVTSLPLLYLSTLIASDSLNANDG